MCGQPVRKGSAVDRGRLTAVVDACLQCTLDLAWREGGFRQAFARRVGPHPMLRSSFALAGHSQPPQIVHSEVPDGHRITDLRAVSEESVKVAMSQHVQERRVHRYVFENAPLYLFQLFVCAGRLKFTFRFHHAMLDGGRVATLLSALQSDYAHAVGIGTEHVAYSMLPSPANYVRSELRALASGMAAPNRDSYERALADPAAELLQLPSVFIASSIDTGTGRAAPRRPSRLHVRSTGALQDRRHATTHGFHAPCGWERVGFVTRRTPLVGLAVLRAPRSRHRAVEFRSGTGAREMVLVSRAASNARHSENLLRRVRGDTHCHVVPRRRLIEQDVAALTLPALPQP
ncbi:condensation domain-containing protein [Streptomyces tendae]|uniref:condensation domain-containing protein n=1 Tax=Streptomyces tendae TaxID=1932 RepID=UPI003696470E